MMKKSLPGWFFEKTWSIFGRPKIAARLSPILSLFPVCENGLRDAFLKTHPSRDFFTSLVLSVPKQALAAAGAPTAARPAPAGGRLLGNEKCQGVSLSLTI